MSVLTDATTHHVSYGCDVCEQLVAELAVLRQQLAFERDARPGPGLWLVEGEPGGGAYSLSRIGTPAEITAPLDLARLAAHTDLLAAAVVVARRRAMPKGRGYLPSAYDIAEQIVQALYDQQQREQAEQKAA